MFFAVALRDSWIHETEVNRLLTVLCRLSVAEMKRTDILAFRWMKSNRHTIFSVDENEQTY